MTEQIAQKMYDALAKAFNALDRGRALRAKDRDEVMNAAAGALALWEERDYSANPAKDQ
jgi:hypothetical protein